MFDLYISFEINLFFLFSFFQRLEKKTKKY